MIKIKNIYKKIKEICTVKAEALLNGSEMSG